MMSRWRQGSEPSRLILNRPLLRAISVTARPYRMRIGLLGLLITVATLLPLVQPILYRAAIDGLVTRAPFGDILLLATVAGVVTILGILLTYGYTVSAARLGRRIIADLQVQMYDRLAGMPLEFFTTLKGGAAGARLTTDVYATEPLFTRVLVALVANVLTLLGAMAVLITVDLRLALPLLVVPFIFWPVRALEERVSTLIRAQNGLNTQVATAAEAVLSTPGMTLTRQAGQLPREVARFHATIEQLRNRAATLTELYVRITTGFNLLFGVILSVIFLGGAWFVSTNEMSLGTLVLFLLYVRQIQVPVSALGGLRFEALRAARAFDRVYEVIESRPEERRPAASEAGGRAQPEAVTLAFEAVAFRYRAFGDLAIPSLTQEPAEPAIDLKRQGEMPLVLDGVSFRVARGESVAIVGASGAGKSTIALLAAGLYEPTSGTVHVDGRSTSSWSEVDLAHRVALITQDTYVLHDTVRANLRYVNEAATDAELAAACEAAHLARLIAGLSDGLDTLVGERGYRLSGGERQRLAVARALLKQADLVILDEPTSQLDAETELLIKQTTNRLFADRAVLTIAHRLSTIADADRILVLQDGHFVEEGTHEALMARPGGRYAALYGAQVRGVSPPI